MNERAIIYLTILGLGLGAGAAQALSKLEAISMIETGNNDTAVGGAGEVSRYQIMPKVWRQFTDSRAYRNTELSTWVAGQYLAWLEGNFRRQAGREASDFDRYVLWNAGLAYYERVGFSAKRVHPVIRERAARFVNLREMKAHPVAPPAGKPAGPAPMFALGGAAR